MDRRKIVGCNGGVMPFTQGGKMNKEFHEGNRQRMYRQMKDHSLLVLFSGMEVRKTNDEYYPFYTDRNFLYLIGLDSKEFVFVARKESDDQIKEKIYILRPDFMKERWTGERMKPEQAAQLSGIEEVGFSDEFSSEFHKLAFSGYYKHLYLDLYRVDPEDRDQPAFQAGK